MCDKRLEISPSLPSISIDFQSSRVHACVRLYTDTWLIFYPVTRFLSLRPKEQTDGCEVIKSCSLRQKKSDVPAQISHPVFLFISLPPSQWLILPDGSR